MSPLASVPLNPVDAMRQRSALIAKADEIFSQLGGDETTPLQQKLFWVEQVVQATTPICVFQNETYIIDVYRKGDFIHLDIRRHDQQPCTSWNDLQQIKNQIVGPEHEAIELFPAESRLVDMANQYHLWVHANPAYRFPVGFSKRCVLDQQGAPTAGRGGDSCAHAA